MIVLINFYQNGQNGLFSWIIIIIIKIIIIISQGKIIKKPNKQELSSLFMTHCLNVMHAPVKFHKHIPYGLGVMARTRIGTYVCTGRIWN